jgi:hypothetical protein
MTVPFSRFGGRGRGGEEVFLRLVIDLALAVIHARIGTGDLSGSASAAVRNPGFLLRHARGAAKRGRRELEGLAAGLANSGFRFLAPYAQYELAKLDRHEGRADDVRRHAETILQCLADEPDAPYARQATELLVQA